MTTYPLSLVEFKSWLESKDESCNVGLQGASWGCPIFKCLQDKNNSIREGNAVVYRLTTNIKNELIENPSWVKDFISKIDSLPLVEEPGEAIFIPVTAQQALEVVNNLYICTVCNKYNPEGKNCGKDKCDW